MSKVDNKKIGDAAVGAVKHHFQCAKCICPFISSNDNGICTDGHLEMYRNSEKMDKDSLFGKIDVQVKGTLSEPSSELKTRKQVKVADIKRYFDVYGGVLYLIVHLNDDLDVVGIYYKQYLPYDIEKSLRRCKAGQKTLTEEFEQLPKETAVLTALCHNFIINKKKQASVVQAGIKSPEELIQKGINFKGFELTLPHIKNSDEISLSTISGSYIYGISHWDESYVLDKIDNALELSETQEARIKCGQYSCNTEITIKEDRDNRYLIIGGIKLSAQGSLSFEPRGDCHEQHRDCMIMAELLSGHTLEIDDQIAVEVKKNGDTSVEKEFRRRANWLSDCEKVLAALHVKAHWSVEALISNQRWLALLQKAFVKHEPITFSKHDESLFGINVDISETRIKVLALRRDDGRYDLYDPLTKDLSYSPGFDDSPPDKTCLVPAFLSLTSEDYSIAANLDVEKFKEALAVLPPVEKTKDIMLEKLIDMLKAYDSGAICSLELIECCDVLSESLLSISTEETFALNRAQVMVRKGEPFDRDAIGTIALFTSNAASKALAYTILEEYDLARKVIALMPEEDQNLYILSPAYSLLEEHE